MPIGKIAPVLNRTQSEFRQRSKTCIEPVRKTVSVAENGVFEKLEPIEEKVSIQGDVVQPFLSIRERSLLFEKHVRSSTEPKTKNVSKEVSKEASKEVSKAQTQPSKPIAELAPELCPTPPLPKKVLQKIDWVVDSPVKPLRPVDSPIKPMDSPLKPIDGRQPTDIQLKSLSSLCITEQESLEQQLERLIKAEIQLKQVAERLSQQLDSKEQRHEEERMEWQSVLHKVVNDLEEEKKRHDRCKGMLEKVRIDEGLLKKEVAQLHIRLSDKDGIIGSLVNQLDEATKRIVALEEASLEKKKPELTIDVSCQKSSSEDEDTAVERPPWEETLKRDSAATIFSSQTDLKPLRLSRMSSRLDKKLSRNQSFFNNFVPVSTRIVQNFESLLQELENSRENKRRQNDFQLNREVVQQTDVVTVSSF